SPNGSATLSTSFAIPASHLLSAAYSGDSNFGASQSNSMAIVIANPGYSVRIVPGALTVERGQAGLADITLTPSGGYTGTFTLSCSGIPQYSLCLLSTTQAVADGSDKPLTIQLKLQTSGFGFRYGATAVAMLRQHGGPLLAMIFFLPGGLVMLGTKKRAVRLKHLLMLLLLCAGLTSLSACSGMQPILTPTGDYSITVMVNATTGKAESASLNLKVVP
ncbi:MAG: Ig-like domain-containing protein, partial [Acidobacteriaceae bacterium]